MIFAKAIPSSSSITPNFDVARSTFELLEQSTSAAHVVHPYEILQALGAANTLMAMTEDTSIDSLSLACPTDSSCDGSSDGYDSDCHQDTSSTKINLYDPSDEGHIGGFHNIFRRDIYEGYVIPEGEKYGGTVAFRCRFCQHLPYKARAKQSEVYPRTIEGLYRAHIRFNHDHFPKCKFIPNEIKAKVAKLKKSCPRGDKSHWVTSALNKGLVNGADGIVLCSAAK